MAVNRIGYLAYLAVVFLNAFVDLGHKILVQNTIFKLYDGSEQMLLTAVINGFILLPFIALARPAGALSDRLAKPRVMQLAAAAAVLLALAITACYYAGWFVAAFAMTLLLAGQSALFSPAKFGYIRELFGTAGLARGNGAQQAVTIVAILLGTFAFSIGFELRFEAALAQPAAVIRRMAPLGWLLVAASAAELWLSTRLPVVAAETDGRVLPAAPARPQGVLRQPALRVPVIGLTLFWCVSQVLLAVYPAYAKDALGITNTIVIQGVLTASGLGIVLGSLLAARLSRGLVETALIPVGAVGIAVSLGLLPWLPSAWWAALGMLLIGTAGGMFVVPLNALLQFHASERHMGKVIAGNNLVQNMAMLAALVLTAVAALAMVAPLAVLMTLVGLALLALIYLLVALPQSLARWRWWVQHRTWPRIEVRGLEALAGRRQAQVRGLGCGAELAILQLASPVALRPASVPGLSTAEVMVKASCNRTAGGYRVGFVAAGEPAQSEAAISPPAPALSPR